MVNLATRYDDARGDDGIGGVSDAVAGRMHELGRRKIARTRINRPFHIVKVEFGDVGDEIHMRIVELPRRASRHDPWWWPLESRSC